MYLSPDPANNQVDKQGAKQLYNSNWKQLTVLHLGISPLIYKGIDSATKGFIG